MHITESFTIAAPRAKVWELLLDIPRLSQCVPGVESVEALDENTYRGSLAIRVGPIKSRFSGVVRLTEVVPPGYLAATVEGDDKSNASTVKISFSGTLTPVDSGTEAAFQVEVSLRGRLAQFGEPVIKATARRMTAEFTQNLRAQLEG